MKKFLTLCAVCAMLFACGSNNPGIDYLEKAKEAADKGNLEQAELYMSQFEDWADGLSEEQVAQVSEEVEAWLSENDIYGQIYKLQYDVVEKYDTVDVYDYVEVDDYVEVTEELSNNVEGMLEEIDVQEALEATGNVLETVSEVSDALESVENILSIFE